MKKRHTLLMHALLCLLVLLLTVPSAMAQTEADSTETPPQANPEDVASVDAIIAALYDVISGPAGQARDWDRFRSLATPTCQLIPIQRRQDGGHQHFVMTVEQYIERAGPYLEQNGFFEKESARKTERYGNLVHAFSTYDSFRKAEDTEPFQRGINSIQLLYENDRWWIANIAWQPEWQDLPIPAAYLPDSQ